MKKLYLQYARYIVEISYLTILLCIPTTLLLATPLKKNPTPILSQEQRKQFKIQAHMDYDTLYNQFLAQNYDVKTAAKKARCECKKIYNRLYSHSPEYRQREITNKRCRKLIAQLTQKAIIELTQQNIDNSNFHNDFIHCFDNDIPEETDPNLINLRGEIINYMDHLDKNEFKTIRWYTHKDIDIKDLKDVIPELSYTIYPPKKKGRKLSN